MKIDIVAFSPNGCVLAKEIRDKIKDNETETEAFYKTMEKEDDMTHISGKLADWTGEAFKRCDAIIFIGAIGIAVRMIAPYVVSKTSDPAIICIDEKGQYVISLLSGHIGGGNRLTLDVAEKIGATPIVTTATDLNGLFSVDAFASERGYFIDGIPKIKTISAKILKGDEIGFCSRFPTEGKLPNGLTLTDSGKAGVVITNNPQDKPYDITIKLYPKNIVMGIGCRRDTPVEKIAKLVNRVLSEQNISENSIKLITSLDLKADEEGLLAFAEGRNVPIKFYTAEELMSVNDPNITPSNFVKSITGVENVCERSSIFGSKDGEVILRKTSEDGVTVALVKEKITVNFGESK